MCVDGVDFLLFRAGDLVLKVFLAWWVKWAGNGCNQLTGYVWGFGFMQDWNTCNTMYYVVICGEFMQGNEIFFGSVKFRCLNL